LEEGKQADILIADVVSHESLVSRFGTNRVARVIKKGMLIQTRKTAETGGGGKRRFPV
jgi:imidazolonepropionase-like amidohydrolase